MEREIYLKAVTPDCEQENSVWGVGNVSVLSSAGQLRLRLRAEQATSPRLKVVSKHVLHEVRSLTTVMHPSLNKWISICILALNLQCARFKEHYQSVTLLLIKVSGPVQHRSICPLPAPPNTHLCLF